MAIQICLTRKSGFFGKVMFGENAVVRIFWSPDLGEPEWSSANKFLGKRASVKYEVESCGLLGLYGWEWDGKLIVRVILHPS